MDLKGNVLHLKRQEVRDIVSGIDKEAATVPFFLRQLEQATYDDDWIDSARNKKRKSTMHESTVLFVDKEEQESAALRFAALAERACELVVNNPEASCAEKMRHRRLQETLTAIATGGAVIHSIEIAARDSS